MVRRLKSRSVKKSGPERKGAVGPMLMAPPLTNSGRRFTFAVAGKGRGANQAVTVVEAWFRWPIGLWRLQSSPTAASEYIRWAKSMCKTRQPSDPSLPERVSVDRGMFARKLWEIGVAVDQRRLGDEVDMALARRLAQASAFVPHPARSMDPTVGRVLTMRELGARPEILRAFYQPASLTALEQAWGESGGITGIRGGDDAVLERVVKGWTIDWGADVLEEVMSDLAAYCAAADFPDGAATFLALLKDPAQQQNAIIDFLSRWTRHHFEGRTRLGP